MSAANSGTGWYEWHHAPAMTTHCAYVHENGQTFDPDFGWDSPEFHEALHSDRAHRLVRADGTDGQSTLDGATEMTPEGVRRLTAGEFAASWNAAEPADRQKWFDWLAGSLEAASLCVIQDHASLVERERMSWLTSHELHVWAERMRTFVEQWRKNPQNGPDIYAVNWMEGPDDARMERFESVTTRDLIIAAELARRIAHDHIAYAVMVDVKHYERRLGKGAEREQAEIISIDRRVLLDDVAVDDLMTQAGWIES